MRLEDIKTPAYVCEITKLKANLNLLNYVAKSSGAKVLCALKGFAFSPSMPLVATMLDGATCSDCRIYHNKVYDLKNKPEIPRHPMCRCFYEIAE